eukprot:CAMPEP_0194131928 /NCGR_PEP_ID=MMETSP0152-20130528/2541_1 /TAXON_ID=1049557 /ORGANISM="Thalassiothrix antarctica, Strain L6-D1" /LENGTH=533 /DNA_ID=CAMNT_0038826823 /DNA_START=268 /DNA_END=1869 /DNA_ORIENTATION=-
MTEEEDDETSGATTTLTKTREDFKTITKSNDETISPIITLNNDDNDNLSEDNSSSVILEEVLAGLVVALATVPTSIAYANIAGVDPLTGLWSSVVVGGILGASSPGVMAGAAGVVVVPLGALSSSYSSALIPLATFLAGIMETMFGLLRLGSLAEYVTAPTMNGLLNGFGVYLVTLQRKVLLQEGGIWIQDEQLLLNTVGAMLATAILAGFVLPKLKESATNNEIPGGVIFSVVPPTLGALVFVSVMSNLLGLDLATLSDVVPPHTFDGGLSSLPKWPPQLPIADDFQSSLMTVAPTAFSIALIGVLETLLAARLVEDAITSDNNNNVSSNNNKNKDEALISSDESNIIDGMEYEWIDDGKKSKDDAVVANKNKNNIACIGLGAGNVLSSTLGGIGGCGLLPQTILNIKSGGRTSISGFSYATALILCTVVAAPLIGMIPRAAIGGLMLVVAYNTIQWKETQTIIGEATTVTTSGEKSEIDNDSITNISSAAQANAIALVVSSIICYKGEYGIGVLLGAIICAIGKSLDDEEN